MTQEKSRAEARFDAIEARLTRMEVRLDQVGEDCEDTRNLLRRVVFGTNGEAGHKIRIDRLEQWKGTATRFLWLLAGCCGTISSAVIIWVVTR